MQKSEPKARRPALRGAKAIGAYLFAAGVVGGNEREQTKRAYYMLDRGVIPAGKICGSWIADPDMLDARIAEICSGRRHEQASR
jgi:hypothetical protein